MPTSKIVLATNANKRRRAACARFAAALFLGWAQSVLAVPSDALANQLRNHPSPYLALHGRDPVAWQEWGPEVVARAQRENKLIYLSIGYFSCHWCHVMQRESYRNRGIAQFLNTHFIPVKIDRELEPALDARMLKFAQDTRGMAGWPLNVFLTPAGAPVFASLYSPPDEFRQIIARVQRLWRDDAARVLALSSEGRNVRAQGPGAPALEPLIARDLTARFASASLAQADTVQGGFGAQSKFPNVPQLSLLLDLVAEERAPSAAREFLLLTLESMANYGLRDHLGGGFFRYTVDPAWTTPHFEKMLYDNAQLASLYLRAARVLARPDFAQVARETLDFMLRELWDANGAFIASLSAVDARNVEGGYYLWSLDELRARLTTRELAVYRAAWHMQDAPPFDDGYLPIRGASTDEIAQAQRLNAAEVAALLQSAQAKLRAARAQRSVPRDGKLLAAWNGLALSALANGVRAGYEQYRQPAQRVRDYLATQLWNGSELRRALASGRALGEAGLEDYAYVAQGLLAWYAVTRAPQDRALAHALVNAAWKKFYDRGWVLADRTWIPQQAPQDVLADGALPAPAAVLLEASVQVANLTGDVRLRERALAALNTGLANVRDDAYWYPSHIRALFRRAR